MAVKRKTAQSKIERKQEDLKPVPLPPLEEAPIVAPPVEQISYKETPPPPLAQEPSAPRFNRRTKRVLIALFLVILIFFAAARIFHWWNWGLSIQEVQQELAASLVQKVGTLILLPNEAPTLATVTNASVLRASQVFYVNAQNGDVLFIFPHTGEAILYRPSENKIINVASIAMNPSQQQATSSKK